MGICLSKYFQMTCGIKEDKMLVTALSVIYCSSLCFYHSPCQPNRARPSPPASYIVCLQILLFKPSLRQAELWMNMQLWKFIMIDHVISVSVIVINRCSDEFGPGRTWWWPRQHEIWWKRLPRNSLCRKNPASVTSFSSADKGFFLPPSFRL